MENLTTSDKFGPMLNAYPDSIGGCLSGCIDFLKSLDNIFTDFYVLPSVFDSDLDRGFSVISYDLNRELADLSDLSELKKLNVNLKLDFVLNHASVLSKQFRDILKKGESSEYIDFFIDWNKFWSGCGEMTGEGYIQPDEKHLKDMHFRKPDLPLLMVPMPDGTEKPYWNTFYQEVLYPTFTAEDFMLVADMQYSSAEKLSSIVNEALKSAIQPEEINFDKHIEKRHTLIKFIKSRKRFLGQMDLNIESPKVWEFYKETLCKLAAYGAKIVRLDAFAYAPKKPGARNFMNDPDTWNYLGKIREIASDYELSLLPEVHAEYAAGLHEKLSDEGYLIYDFFLPGLLIHAMEKNTCEYILHWVGDIQKKQLSTVSMLGCHDGIPLLDLRGLLPETEIEDTIKIIVERGGYVKDILGSKSMYYQVNATYFSALGEDVDKMLLARAVHIFMPGKPQIWYLDLFGGKNDYEAVRLAGAGGHKEINRTNLSIEQANLSLSSDLTAKQLDLIRLRSTCPAFGDGATLTAGGKKHQMYLQWDLDCNTARLDVDFKAYTYEISLNSK
ncbi:MAG: glycosidase [Oscillospiraceae bacterium]|nr:glycosidase [Oscillospiraceae bacterium]